MRRLLSVRELSSTDIEQLFDITRRIRDGHRPAFKGRTCGYSFEGSGVRTRSTFLKALAGLEVTAIELPNVLKGKESKRHLAGYLDNWIDIYVIRESSHASLEEFVTASKKPVVNAMSSEGHPCEVLSDAFWLRSRFGRLDGLKFCVVGPPTNVLNSWTEICLVLGLNSTRVLPAQFAPPRGMRATASLEEGLRNADVVVTDSWPAMFSDPAYQVTLDRLSIASKDVLVIPCPPFNVAQEVSQDVIDSAHFAGYEQKSSLYFVEMAVVAALLSQQ